MISVDFTKKCFQKACQTFLIGSVLVLNPVQAFSAENISAEEMAQKRQAANRYFEAIDMEKTFRDVMTEVAKSPMPGVGSDFNDYFQRYQKLLMENLDIKGLFKAHESVIVEIFSLEELEAVADFYSSPIGKSIGQKLPAYTAASMPATQKFIQEAVAKTMPTLIEEMKQQKEK